MWLVICNIALRDSTGILFRVLVLHWCDCIIVVGVVIVVIIIN